MSIAASWRLESISYCYIQPANWKIGKSLFFRIFSLGAGIWDQDELMFDLFQLSALVLAEKGLHFALCRWMPCKYFLLFPPENRASDKWLHMLTVIFRCWWTHATAFRQSSPVNRTMYLLVWEPEHVLVCLRKIFAAHCWQMHRLLSSCTRSQSLVWKLPVGAEQGLGQTLLWVSSHLHKLKWHHPEGCWTSWVNNVGTQL